MSFRIANDGPPVVPAGPREAEASGMESEMARLLNALQCSGPVNPGTPADDSAAVNEDLWLALVDLQLRVDAAQTGDDPVVASPRRM